jgi:cytochrome c556
VDEVRMTSERAMFLLAKMQLIVGFQAELVYKQLVMQPEVVKVLEDVTKFRETTERFAVLLEKLPADVAGTFANLQQTTADAERLLGEAEKTGLVFKDLVQSVDHLASKFESKGTEEPARPFDIKEFTEALELLQNTVQQLSELVIAVDQTSSPWITNITKVFHDAAKKRVDHVFWRLAELFAIIALFVIIIVVVHNLLKRRLAHRPNQEASL